MAQNRAQSGQQGTQIDRYIQDADFPCKKQELERVAQRNDAPRSVIDNIRQMPDRRYNDLNEVRTAVGQVESTLR